MKAIIQTAAVLACLATVLPGQAETKPAPDKLSSVARAVSVSPT